MLRIKVKASSITNLTDARYFAAWEVEWLGFCLDPADERYVRPQVVNAIKEWVDGPKITGEFGLQSAADVKAAIELLGLDAVQLSPVMETQALIDLQSTVPLIREIVIERDADADELAHQLEMEQPLVSAFLLNFDKNGITWADVRNGHVFSVDFLRDACNLYPVLLSLDAGPGLLEELLEDVRPLGLSLRGGEEEKVGFKSFDQLDEIFEQLEVQV